MDFLHIPGAPKLTAYTFTPTEWKSLMRSASSKHHDVIQLSPQECISERIVEQVVDVPVPPRASLLVSPHLVKSSWTFI